jgi:N-hydroxyarylamine O-acetyltransferase
MLLLVDLDDRAYVADVGFAELTLTAALCLQPDLGQATPHGLFRLTRTRDAFVMQAAVGRMWKALYQFDAQEQCAADYELINWYLSRHPDSPFVRDLIASRVDTNRRYVLRNHDLTVHHLNGQIERRHLATAVDVQAVLEDLLQINLPAGPELIAVLERRRERAHCT